MNNHNHQTPQQSAALELYRQIYSTHPSWHRRTRAIRAYCLEDEGIPQAALDGLLPMFDQHQTNLFNQFQNHQRRLHHPGRPTFTLEQQKAAAVADHHELGTAMDEGRVILKMFPMGLPNLTKYVQIPARSIDNELNRQRAMLSMKLEPFYFPNVLQEMRWTRDRPAHYPYTDGCNAIHFHAPAFEVRHNLNATLPIPIIDRIANIDPIMSNFTNAAGWGGHQHNFFDGVDPWLGAPHLIGPERQYSTIPTHAERLRDEYQCWIPNFETHPTLLDQSNRMHNDMFRRQIINPIRRWFNWDVVERNRYFNRVRNSFCPIPGNSQHFRCRGYQGHHHDYQARRVNNGLHSYANIAFASNNNLQDRYTNLMANLNAIGDHLEDGNYAENEGDIVGTVSLYYHICTSHFFFSNTFTSSPK